MSEQEDNLMCQSCGYLYVNGKISIHKYSILHEIGIGILREGIFYEPSRIYGGSCRSVLFCGRALVVIEGTFITVGKCPSCATDRWINIHLPNSQRQLEAESRLMKSKFRRRIVCAVWASLKPSGCFYEAI